MANLVSAAETNTGNAEALGFLAGLTSGGAMMTPNDAGFVNFIDANVVATGINASGVLAAFVSSANTFLADPAGVADAIAQANKALA
jgi:hypothetical protein